jgi:hypothetical protein
LTKDIRDSFRAWLILLTKELGQRSTITATSTHRNVIFIVFAIISLDVTGAGYGEDGEQAPKKINSNTRSRPLVP